MSTEDCPCGDEHEIPVGCGHHTDKTQTCHRSAIMPCPSHFTTASTAALVAAVPGWNPGADGTFVAAVDHLNRDGYMHAAYYTWMAMLGRYAVPEGMDREQALASLPSAQAPDGAPEYVRMVAPMITYASRAAVAGDGQTVEATLMAVRETLEGAAVVSFLISAAASAHINVDRNDLCTPDHITLFHLLGSQVSDGAGLEVLPFLVDMTYAQMSADSETAVNIFERLMELPGTRPLVVAVDMVSRTLAQIISENVTVLTANGHPEAGGSVTGILDIGRATPENTGDELMAGVWAVRAAQAYAAADSSHAATTALQKVVAEHGRPFHFGVDVVLGATQLIGYMVEPDTEDPEPEPS